MADTPADTPPLSLRDLARTVLREDAAAWLFVLRAALALYLTGWLAMRLALPQPSTAMLTVIIVMNRQTGMVLAKSFYRAIGTVAGAAVALLMLALFPQDRLLLLVLAVWVGLCAGGALLYRNFASYGFVLAGYTASIVALPSIDAPLGAFDAAVARISEVLLGILVAGVVSDTVFPTRMRNTLRRAAYDQFAHFMAFVAGSTGGTIARPAMEQAHLRFVRDAIALEDLRSAVIFEDVDARARSGRLQVFNQRFMEASTSFQSLHHLINRLQRSGRAPVAQALIELYRPLGEALARPVEAGDAASALLPTLAGARRRVAAAAVSARARVEPERRIDFDTGASLLLRFTDELIAYVDVAAVLQAPRLTGGVGGEKVRFVRGNDVLGAGLAALHTSLTMLLLGLFWIASAWPSGASAMLIAAIFCGLFAAAPNPVRQAGQSMAGWIAGIVTSFTLVFFALTQVDGYGLLVATTLPVFLVAPYLLTRPTLVSYGVGYGMGLVYNLALTNAMHYDPVRFLNDALAQLVGLGSAVAAFALVPPAAATPWFQRRQMARLRGQVAFAATASLAGLAYRFESVNRDLLNQIVARTPPGSDASRALIAWALAVHETGRALIELRRAEQAAPHAPRTHALIDQAVQALARFYARPDTRLYVDAREALAAATAAVQVDTQASAASDPALEHLHLLRTALLHDESVVADFMPRSIAQTAPEETRDGP